MYIKKISIKNFKAITRRDITIGNHDLEIEGASNTGKTSIFDAYTWVLTGRLSDGLSIGYDNFESIINQKVLDINVTFDPDKEYAAYTEARNNIQTLCKFCERLRSNAVEMYPCVTIETDEFTAQRRLTCGDIYHLPDNSKLRNCDFEYLYNGERMTPLEFQRAMQRHFPNPFLVNIGQWYHMTLVERDQMLQGLEGLRHERTSGHEEWHIANGDRTFYGSFKQLSRGERLLILTEVFRLLNKKHGIRLPLWIDNVEQYDDSALDVAMELPCQLMLLAMREKSKEIEITHGIDLGADGMERAELVHLLKIEEQEKIDEFCRRNNERQAADAVECDDSEQSNERRAAGAGEVFVGASSSDVRVHGETGEKSSGHHEAGEELRGTDGNGTAVASACGQDDNCKRAGEPSARRGGGAAVSDTVSVKPQYTVADAINDTIEDLEAALDGIHEYMAEQAKKQALREEEHLQRMRKIIEEANKAAETRPVLIHWEDYDDIADMAETAAEENERILNGEW